MAEDIWSWRWLGFLETKKPRLVHGGDCGKSQPPSRQVCHLSSSTTETPLARSILLATGPRGNGPTRVGFFHQQVKDEWAIYAHRAEPAIFQQRPRARGMALCRLYGAQPVRAYPARDRRAPTKDIV